MGKPSFAAFRKALTKHLRDNPGKPVPYDALAEELGRGRETVKNLCHKIKREHGLPRLPRGGPNFALPKNVLDEIRKICDETPQGAKIDAWKAIRRIARKTGRAITGLTLRRRVLEMTEGKVNVTNPRWLGKTRQVLDALGKAGIKAEGKEYASRGY